MYIKSVRANTAEIFQVNWYGLIKKEKRKTWKEYRWKPEFYLSHVTEFKASKSGTLKTR